MSYHFRIEERRDLTTKLTYKMDTEMKKGGVPGIKPAKKRIKMQKSKKQSVFNKSMFNHFNYKLNILSRDFIYIQVFIILL